MYLGRRWAYNEESEIMNVNETIIVLLHEITFIDF
jgi:hypothetical protein